MMDYTGITSKMIPSLDQVCQMLRKPRATSFTFAEQDITQEIVAEGSPEHFTAESEPFFQNPRLPQEIQGHFPQYIQILRRMVRPHTAIVLPKAYVQKPGPNPIW